MRQAILYRASDGWWAAEVPSLPGCVSQAKSREDTIRNITAAAERWVAAARERGDVIPAESSPVEIVQLNVS